MNALITAAGVLGYLVVATVVMRLDAHVDRRFRLESTPAVTIVIGLAWPLSLPLYAAGAVLYGLYRIATWRIR